MTACAGSLTGCARMLDWSEAQHRGAAVERTLAGQEEGTASVPATRTNEATATASGQRPPDLAVRQGDDPRENVRAAIEAMGGMGLYVKRGAAVVIKPNMLTSRAPEYAATTNPDVVAALVELAYEAGAAEVTVFDRPTAPARTVYDVSGIAAAVEAVDGRMKILSDRDYERIAFPEGKVLDSWPLAADIFDADVFINVPIAKTHGLAGLTMSMKNLMGIMGGVRGTIHQDFAEKIVDVNTLVRPHLVVLDAYRMLTAHGPTGGDLADVRLAKTVVVGTGQVSVDAYGSTLFGKKPTDLDYLRVAQERGLGTLDLGTLLIDEGAT